MAFFWTELSPGSVKGPGTCPLDLVCSLRSERRASQAGGKDGPAPLCWHLWRGVWAGGTFEWTLLYFSLSRCVSKERKVPAFPVVTDSLGPQKVPCHLGVQPQASPTGWGGGTVSALAF